MITSHALYQLSHASGLVNGVIHWLYQRRLPFRQDGYQKMDPAIKIFDFSIGPYRTHFKKEQKMLTLGFEPRIS